MMGELSLKFRGGNHMSEGTHCGWICSKMKSCCQLSMRHQTAQKCSCHGRRACLNEAAETTSHNLHPAPLFAVPVLQYLYCKAQATAAATQAERVLAQAAVPVLAQAPKEGNPKRAATSDKDLL
ncbi:uncharacterized protein LOC144114886 [Amblyomma americanum]